ncbi:MAG: protoporphyrinogen oxidase [Pirellulales bacterium]|nr:protoporphyrinogen oxidase [Pirellulales bacterium]
MTDLQFSTGQARFAVIGGGISGLTAAYRLSQLRPETSVEIFEASGRLGGVLDTYRTDKLLIERGADSFFNKLPWAAELCEELGLAPELIPTKEGERRALVLRAGRLHPVPEGFVVLQPQRLLPILLSPLLSWRGKLRLFCEGWVQRSQELHHTDYDESVASFATRRLGRETFEQLVQPLLAGIYTADPYQLSLAATMPEAIEAEREHGSLRSAIRAMKNNQDAQASGARYARFVTLRKGLGQLVETLANRLPTDHIHLSAPVDKVVRKENGKWFVVQKEGDKHGPYEGIIVAIPAPRAAELVRQLDSQLKHLLQKIPYASSAVVSLVYQRDQIARAAPGFGFVVPSVEKRKIVAASFSNKKFPGRAPDNQLLVRVFLGGALQSELFNLSDGELCELARSELADILDVAGQPLHVNLVRWQEKMPQYHVGHVQLVSALERRVVDLPGLELAGNAYHGVGIPQCVHSGDTAARRLVARALQGV